MQCFKPAGKALPMSSDIVLSIHHLSKQYRMYASPAARIYHYIHTALRRLVGLPEKNNTPVFHALKDISLTLHRGDSLGILGRNGAGKSTLLQIISGTLYPTSGHVDIQGRVAALLELGSGFNMEFTGRENATMNCALLGLNKTQTEDCLQTIIDFSEIAEFIDQPVKTYSSGMLMRLAFSVQIAVEPDILIIDEALAVGDVFFMSKCIEFMKTHMQHTTRIFVSHDHAAVANLCNKAIFIDRGELISTGTPLECIEAYTRFVHNDGDTNHRQEASSDKLPAGFLPIPTNKRGGKSNVTMTGYRLTIEQRPFSGIVYPQDTVQVDLLLDVHHRIDDAILGYFCRDLFGNPIFGETTLSLHTQKINLPEGQRLVASLVWQWPEVKESHYIFTFGIGSGNDPLFHHIECWSNNILTMQSATRGKAIHGLFNCPLIACEIQQHP
jgi:ABC-type polysaccharide/polyol phosphate transport system ATPase subunit